MEKKIKLRISTSKLGDIRDVIGYLKSIEDVYNHLYAFELIITDAKKRSEDYNDTTNYGRSRKIKSLMSIRHPDQIVHPQDRIILNKVNVESPGFWEFFANIIPLETIRKYINDRHERIKDKNYRINQEKERGELENEKLRLEVIQKKTDLLKNLGVPEDKIRIAYFKHVLKPLEQIDIYQDKGLIESAEIVEDDNKE